jgi:hypothetical protein
MKDSKPSNRILAAAREPLVHFLLIGALIYGVYGLTRPEVDEDPENRITVTAGEIEWLTGSWEKRWNRAPTPQERAGLIDQFVRETVFYREALAMGLDRDDTIIRRRLAQKLEFLSEDLVETVAPTEEQLKDYFSESGEKYELPALLTMTHVFVDPDKREDQTLADAERIGEELRALEPPTEGAEDLGDPFMLQHYYPERSEVEIAKLFGAEFARSVFELAPDRWHGPVLSGYGVHWVFVEQRLPAEAPEFAAVRDRVEQDWRDERREKFNDEFYAQLRARYEVVIEDGTVSAIEDETVSETEEEPANLVEEEPANLVEDEPASLVEDEPASVVKDEPASVVKDTAASENLAAVSGNAR